MGKRRASVLIVVLAALPLAAQACGLVGGTAPVTEPSGQAAGVSQPPASPPPAPEAPSPSPSPVIDRVTLTGVGDNLIHGAIFRQARTGDGYDFTSDYANVAADFQAADLAFINQEVPLSASFPPSHYPLFNAPTQVLDATLAAGFDVFNTANNHMLDMGSRGLKDTVELIKGRDGAPLCGPDDTPEGSEQAGYVEREGIKFAFLGYPEHTNGLALPESDAYMITYTSERERIAKQLDAARAQADVLVVSVHWGVEYAYDVSPEQRDFAQFLHAHGVDLVIGTGPHVIEPYQAITGGERTTHVYYSLGNFYSAQDQPTRLVGAVMNVEAAKDRATGEVVVTPLPTTFVVTHYGANYEGIHLERWADYTEDMAATHQMHRQYPSQFTVAALGEFLAGFDLP